MRRFWQLFSFSAAAAIVSLCLLQLAGWFQVPGEKAALFVLFVLTAAGAASGVSTALERLRTRCWLEGAAGAAAGWLAGMYLCTWQFPLVLPRELAGALLIACAAALLTVAGMNKLMAAAQAQSINEEIADRDGRRREAAEREAAGKGQKGERDAEDH